MAKISIITTTYKHQDFIAQTIESILAQTHTDWELLIGDDSPDDATWNIIQGYVNQYPDKIKARHHSPNKGIVDNMNFLIEKVSESSEYIAFLEGDDLWMKENLSSKLKIFQQDIKIDLIYSDYKRIDSKNRIIAKKRYQSILPGHRQLGYGKQNISINDLLNGNGNPIISFGSVCIRWNTFQKYLPLINPTNKKNFGPLDWYTWIRILPNSNFYHCNEIGLLYRIHTNNLSGNIENMASDSYSIYNYIEKNTSDSKTLRIISQKKSRLELIFTVAKIQYGDKQQAIFHIKKSFNFARNKYFVAKTFCLILYILPVQISQLILVKLMKKD